MKTDKKIAVFTVDLESFADTGCIQRLSIEVPDLLEGLDTCLELLDSLSIPATVFAVCSAAERSADTLRRAIANGSELALHGLTHTDPDLFSAEEFARRVEEGKKVLADRFGTEPIGFRAPYFHLNDEKRALLRELGFRYDSSCMASPFRGPGSFVSPQNGSPRRGVYREDGFYEFPLTCRRVTGVRYPISGGAYMRLAPGFFTRQILRTYLHTHSFYNYYLHPFELCGTAVPVPDGLSRAQRFYLRQGMETYPARLEKYLRMAKKSGYVFMTFRDFVDRLEDEL